MLFLKRLVVFFTFVLAASTSMSMESSKTWDGMWKGISENGDQVRINFKDGQLQQMSVNSTPFTIVESQISPDKNTIFITLSNGEASLMRVNDVEIESNVFAKTATFRKIRLMREQSGR